MLKLVLRPQKQVRKDPLLMGSHSGPKSKSGGPEQGLFPDLLLGQKGEPKQGIFPGLLHVSCVHRTFFDALNETCNMTFLSQNRLKLSFFFLNFFYLFFIVIFLSFFISRRLMPLCRTLPHLSFLSLFYLVYLFLSFSDDSISRKR